MSAATVRSVTVRMRADVDQYKRDMRSAGQATDDAFSRANRGLGQTHIQLQTVDKDLRTTTLTATQTGTAMTGLTRDTAGLNRGVTGLSRSLDGGTRSLDSYTTRLGLAAEGILLLGPGAVAAAAVAAPALAGITSAASLSVLGFGSVVAGFQGVGEAMEAVNRAQLEPTEANLQAARLAMQQLSPAARGIVRDLDSLGPALRDLRDASAEGLDDGVARSVDNLLVLLPRLRGFFSETAETAGDLAAEATESLTTDRWAPFLRFLERETPVAMEAVAHASGDVAHGLAELWRAFGPLNNDVLGFLERGADGFDKWATGLRKTDDFKDFVAYVRENGPLVGDALASMAGAVLDIAEAAAPLGGPVLRAVSAIADGVSTIADSPLGTPFLAAVTTVLTLNRALKVTQGLAASAGVASILGGGKGRGAAVAPVGVAAGGAAGGRNKAATALRGGTAALGAALILPPLIGDIINGYDGLSLSIDGVARSLKRGQIPSELQGIVEQADRVANGNGILQWLSEFVGNSKEVDTELAALDSAFAQIANSKGIDAAQRAFNDFADNLNLSGSQRSDLLSVLPDMGNQLSTFAGDADSVSAKTRRLAEDLFHLGNTKPPKLDLGLDDDLFQGTIKGAVGALRDFDRIRARPTADLADNPFAQNYNRVDRSMRDLDRQNATATANLNADPFIGRQRNVIAGLSAVDRFTANPTANLIDRASGPAASIRAAIAAIQSKTVTVTTINRVVNIGRAIAGAVGAGADGMMLGAHQPGVLPIRHFAMGGLNDPDDRPNNHRPQISRGMTRVWSEPETGGESYIPWANDHRRPGARSVLEQTAGVLGGEVRWFAEGGTVAGKRFRDAIGGFEITRDSDLKDVRRELREFARDVKRAGGTTTAQFDLFSGRITRVTTRLDAHRAELEKTKKSLTDLRQAQDSTRDSVTSQFRSDLTGALELGDDVPEWLSAEGRAAVRATQLRNQLTQGAASAEDFVENLRQARRSGLSGDLLREVAADAGLTELFAGFTRAQISEYERLFGASRRASVVAGRSAAAVYDPEVKATRQAVQELRKDVRDLMDTRKGISINASSVRAIGKATGGATGDALNDVAGSARRSRK